MRKLFTCFVFSIILAQVKAQTENIITCSDSKLYYRTYGNGNPILIINGGPGMNSDGFKELAIKLALHNQTIIYDQRGTGQSTLEKTDSTTVTMQKMAEDIECLRKQLNIDKWVVLGHSFGGMLASYYATLHPQNIKGLILSSSGGIDLELLSYVSENINAKLNKTQLDSVAYWTNEIHNGDTSYFARLKRGTFLAPAYVYNKKYVPIIAQRLTQGKPQVNDLVWGDLQRINFDCRQQLKSFSKPVLIIQGKQDIVAEKTALKAKETFKNSKLILLDKCVHYGWLDSEKEYFREINKFLVAIKS